RVGAEARAGMLAGGRRRRSQRLLAWSGVCPGVHEEVADPSVRQDFDQLGGRLSHWVTSFLTCRLTAQPCATSRYAPRVVTETDLELSGGGTLHFYDTFADDAARPPPLFFPPPPPQLSPPPQPHLPPP